MLQIFLIKRLYLLTLYFLFCHFGINRAAFMDIKRASAPHNHKHESSAVLRVMEKVTFIISYRKNPSLLQVVNVDHHHHHLILYCCGIYVFVSLSVGCHAFVSTMLACSAERRVLVCTIGTSPFSMWWWVVDACTLFTTPITVSARTCQQWQVPLVDGRRAIYGLHGVAANGLTISVCCTCMFV